MKKWESFTNDIIQYITQNNKECIFLLLGNYSKDKLKFINDESRCIIGVHPSKWNY